MGTLRRRFDLRAFASTAGFQNPGQLEDFVLSKPAVSNLDGFHVDTATFALWGLPGVKRALRIKDSGTPHEHEIVVEFNGPVIPADAKAHLNALREIITDLKPTAVLCHAQAWWLNTLRELQTELRASAKPGAQIYVRQPASSMPGTFHSLTASGTALVGVWPDLVKRGLDERSLNATTLEPRVSRVIDHDRNGRRIMVLHSEAVRLARFQETVPDYDTILGQVRRLIDEAPLLPE